MCYDQSIEKQLEICKLKIEILLKEYDFTLEAEDNRNKIYLTCYDEHSKEIDCND
jgi:hypothetical protein